ncbi:P450-derived glycosyltransferase activator [Micromonospora sp. STR1_7]|uniref:P450-derived glycosyltransferase activator n=1 Tax=Micromonospora parastrephiae TaxID=2806101 RepID=A0ABS1XQ63_9ACTN|nr:P450-derived glycosyltransferase activator [Micromonospora parastrephiae]MBM0231398.1 P450-derived glycosyltransferase activator [Micromonospora parastrephiae]
MITRRSDADLGRHLLTLRTLQWIYGAQADPYALLLRADDSDVAELHRQIRQPGRLHRSSTGAWVTGSGSTAARILSDARLQPSHPNLAGPQEHLIHDEVWVRPICHVLPLVEAPMFLTRADYERLSRLADPVLGDGALGVRHADVVEICLDHLDRLPGQFDLKVDFAASTAMRAVGHLLGVSSTNVEALAGLAPSLALTLDATLCPPQFRAARALTSALSACAALLRSTITTRSGRHDGAISRLLTRPDTAPEPSDVLAVCVLTAAVGVEAAANLLCHAVAELLDRPELWIAVRDDREVAARVVDEVLRLHPPRRLESLVAQEQLELDGEVIPVDGQVVVLVDAAGRDPDIHPRADQFDIDRGPIDDLSTTPGLAASLFVPVARWYAIAALQALATRTLLPGRAGAPLHRLRSPVTRALLRMPLSFDRPTVRERR